MANPTGHINNLSYEILEDIITRLPLRDGARVSTVSKQWGLRWQSVPELVFDTYIERTFDHDIDRVIYRAMLHHQGPLVRFSALLTPDTSHRDIDHWIRHLSSRHQLQYLHLCVQGGSKYITRPPFLTFRHLHHLSLQGCIFRPQPHELKGIFSKLVEFNLWNVDFETATIGRIISQCLLLEIVHIGAYTNEGSIEIEGRKLRLFRFHGFINSIQIKNCPVLADVVLCTPSLEAYKFRPCDCVDYFRYEPGVAKLQSYPRHLPEYFDARGLPNRLFSMKYLNLSLRFTSNQDVYYVLSFIRRCPNLEMLTIGLCRIGMVEDVQVRERPDRNMNQLKKVTLQNFCGDAPQMRLARYLLASADSLKEMVIVPAFSTMCSSLVSNFMEQMNEFPKASPVAQLDIKWK